MHANARQHASEGVDFSLSKRSKHILTAVAPNPPKAPPVAAAGGAPNAGADCPNLFCLSARGCGFAYIL